MESRNFNPKRIYEVLAEIMADRYGAEIEEIEVLVRRKSETAGASARAATQRESANHAI